MAEKYLFFNSTLEDRRKHKASDIAEYWDSFLSSGLIHVNGSPTLKVSANSTDMEVNVDLGKAVILGHLYINDSPLKKIISQSTASEDRFDRVVLRLDLSIENRYIKVFIKEGTALAPPELIRESNIYEVSLAQIHVKKGKSYLEQSDIIDERLDESLCGLASSLVTVPTDVFTKEWEEFVSEYNRWFTEIQSATYATVEDVRKSENNIKREVANLNLQLEATKRVKNGVTFGTNFADSFGMDIDMARTSSDEALNIGQTVVTVRDASDFMAGTEVTIFDDVNLERINIASIDGDVITLERSLVKDYKEGVNVARTMAAKNIFRRYLEFGVFGSYEKKSIDNLNLANLKGNDNHNNGRLAKLQKDWFLSVGMDIHVVKDEEQTAQIFLEGVSKSATYPAVIFNSSKHLFVTGMDTTAYIASYNIHGTELSRIDFANITGNVLGSIDTEKSTILILINHNSQSYLKKIKYDNHGMLTLEKEIQITFSNSSSDRGWLPSYIDDEHNIVLLMSRTRVVSSMNLYCSLVQVKVDKEFVEVTEKVILPETNGTHPADYKKTVMTEVGDEFWAVTEFGTSVQVLKTVDFEQWDIATYDIGGVKPNPFLTRDGTIFVVDADKRKLFKKTPQDEGFVHILDYSSTYFHNRSDVAFLMETDAVIDRPFILSSASTGSVLDGSGVIGYGAEITTNDIRFKTKPTKELVAWTQHDESLTIDEVRTGNAYAELSTVGSETQAVGVSTQEFDETRVTISRASVDDDVKVTRILGGVE